MRRPPSHKKSNAITTTMVLILHNGTPKNFQYFTRFNGESLPYMLLGLPTKTSINWIWKRGEGNHHILGHSRYDARTFHLVEYLVRPQSMQYISSLSSSPLYLKLLRCRSMVNLGHVQGTFELAIPGHTCLIYNHDVLFHVKVAETDPISSYLGFRMDFMQFLLACMITNWGIIVGSAQTNYLSCMSSKASSYACWAFMSRWGGHPCRLTIFI